jgi:hypothetical protein
MIVWASWCICHEIRFLKFMAKLYSVVTPTADIRLFQRSGIFCMTFYFTCYNIFICNRINELFDHIFIFLIISVYIFNHIFNHICVFSMVLYYCNKWKTFFCFSSYYLLYTWKCVTYLYSLYSAKHYTVAVKFSPEFGNFFYSIWISLLVCVIIQHIFVCCVCLLSLCHEWDLIFR